MVTGFERMKRVFGVDAESWARRHGITPYTGPCQECGRERTTSVPFADGDLRGLIAPRCECGHEGTPYCVVVARGRGDLFDWLARESR